MAFSFKLGSIRVKLSRSTVTVTTERADNARKSAKRTATRNLRRARHALNNARREREEAQGALYDAHAKIDAAHREIDSLKDSLKAWESGNAISMTDAGTVKPRNVKRSRNPNVTATRIETLHRVID